MSVFTNARLTGGKSAIADRNRISFLRGTQETRVEAEEVLFAMGRIANTASLGLDNVGVKMENHRIIADDEMRTSAPASFAAGDCTGPYEIVHLAVMEGKSRGAALCRQGKPCRMDYRLMTSIVFTGTRKWRELGLTEKKAQAKKNSRISRREPSFRGPWQGATDHGSEGWVCGGAG